MRSHPIARVTLAAAALTLLASSAASAQIDTRAPNEFGRTLQSSAITSALDDSALNNRVQDTAKRFHELMGGKTSGQHDGWRELGSLPSTESVTLAVLDLSKVRGNALPTDVIVVSGGDGQANVAIARGGENTVVIDLGQPLPCVTETGQPDSSGECAGGAFAVPSTYSAVEFAVEDGAYLAGVLAAKAAVFNGRLGIISGLADCVECNRYVNGFVAGAQSIKPDIDIKLAYLADDELAGFGDPASAKTFTEVFLDVYQPDVLLSVGRGSTEEMVEATCEAGARAVSAGYDVSVFRPDLDCVLTSITRDIERAVEESLYAFSFGENMRLNTYDVANGGVGITDEWNRLTGMPVDTGEFFASASSAIATGQIEACPDSAACGLPYGNELEADASEG